MPRKPFRLKTREAGTKPAPSFPLFCDYRCGHAAFAPADAVGACRREQAVYCTLLKTYNNKNARCIAHGR